MATKKKEPAEAPAKATKATKAPAKAAKAPAKATKGAKAAKPVKAEKPAKAAPKPPQGPFARLKALHGSKDGLAQTLASSLARAGEDADALRTRLGKASNTQLLRLAGVVETVTKKYGGRSKLVESIGKALGKAKDKDYLAKLETFSLPKLLDLAKSSERRAKAAA